MATKKEETVSNKKSKSSDTDSNNSNDFAIIETGGKQFIVEVGTVISVEKLDESSKTVSFDKVLLKSVKNKVTIGTPYIEKESVQAEILSTEKDKKIRVFKFKKKTGYKKTQGHRQILSTIKVTSLGKKTKETKEVK